MVIDNDHIYPLSLLSVVGSDRAPNAYRYPPAEWNEVGEGTQRGKFATHGTRWTRAASMRKSLFALQIPLLQCASLSVSKEFLDQCANISTILSHDICDPLQRQRQSAFQVSPSLTTLGCTRGWSVPPCEFRVGCTRELYRTR
jgi:hypothetical protein